MNEKLHIPSPEEPFLGLYLSGILFIFFFAFVAAFFLSRPPIKQKTTLERIDQKSDLQEQLKQQRNLAEKLGKKPLNSMTEHNWKEDEVRAVFTYGPRELAEVLCEQNLHNDAIEKPFLSELEKALDRRSPNAPWQCVLKHFFANNLSATNIKNEVRTFVEELEDFDSNTSTFVAQALEGFRKSRERPSSPRFIKWLRRCAFHSKFPASKDCHILLKTLSPKYGRDILETLHLSMRDDDLSENDYLAVVQTLENWGKNGQPANWRVKESSKLPAYDFDFRIGAVLSLCKFVVSSNERIEDAAVNALAELAETSTQADRKMNIFRWRTTCHYAFGGKEEAAFLIDLFRTRDSHNDERHDLFFSIDEGICKSQPKYPLWYCGVRHWIHEEKDISEALSDSFVETRYLEFEELVADDELSK